MFSPFKIEAKDLALIRGDRLLFKSCNFSVSNGDLLQIKGPNGSGKTSLIRLLCGLLEADEGELSLNDQPILADWPEFYRLTTYLGHQPGIKHSMTVLENLKFFAKINQTVANYPFEKAIEQVGLSGYGNQLAAHLSQGQKRRVSLARLLTESSALWILDEPFTALDIVAQDWLSSLIKEQISNNGAVIFTSHQPVALGTEVQAIELGGL